MSIATWITIGLGLLLIVSSLVMTFTRSWGRGYVDDPFPQIFKFKDDA